MSKRQGNSQNPPSQQHYAPRPPYGRGGDTLSIFTLVGVVAVLMISFANWREIDRIQQSLDSRLAQLDNRISQIPNQPAAPSQPTRSGPDPNRAYEIKTAGAFFKGPVGAPITIAEFSDFQ